MDRIHRMSSYTYCLDIEINGGLDSDTYCQVVKFSKLWPISTQNINLNNFDENVKKVVIG